MKQIKLKKIFKKILIKKILEKSPYFLISSEISSNLETHSRKLRLNKSTFLNALLFENEGSFKYPIELILNSNKSRFSNYSFNNVFIRKNLNLIFRGNSQLFFKNVLLNPKYIFENFKNTLLLSLQLILLIKKGLE